jgi:KUP system potassium uptake protein
MFKLREDMARVSSSGVAEASPSELPPTGTPHLMRLSLLALGVVYGDIGTSPLYAVRECFGPHGVPVVGSTVYGVLSLVFWTLTSIVSVKYLVHILRADNHGEGGILALMALSVSHDQRPRHRRVLLMLGVLGAALLYGDGAITPAISVLSAVEGLTTDAPHFHAAVVPITVAILVCLFAIQRRGTAAIGMVFGPITLIWFVTLALLGVVHIVDAPRILLALNPRYAYEFLTAGGGLSGFSVLGAVFLSVTGAEALYADLGHFGRQPIRRAWAWVVCPALLLNYFGQGALLLRDPGAARNPFFLLAPDWALYPLVVLSTAATVIASQALISGVYSMTRQASMLGLLPRMNVLHTSAQQEGQVYVPVINWLLMLVTIGLVLGFQSSSRLAAAYGIAVSLSMIITTLLAYTVVQAWGWSPLRAAAVTGVLLTIEGTFLAANVEKIAHGGWFPLLLAAGLCLLMTTWNRGRLLLAERFRKELLPLTDFFEKITTSAPLRVPGTAVFMTGQLQGTPPALLHNYRHNHVLHENVILLTILTEDAARVPNSERVTVEPAAPGFWRVIGRYGFMEQPDAPDLVLRSGLLTKLDEVTFFLGREHLIVAEHGLGQRWRIALFSFLARSSQPATRFFNIPPDRVMEIGTQIAL